LRLAWLREFHLFLQLTIGCFLRARHLASALFHLLLDVMPIGPFSASLRAHRNAAVEIKEDGEGEEDKQGFLAHPFCKAERVLTVAALYERRK